MIVLHSRAHLTDDDVMLIETRLKDNVWQEFSSIAYNFTSWSSRVLVNLPIHIALHFGLKLWFPGEILMELILILGMIKIFAPKKDFVSCSLLTLFLLMFPFGYMTTAGWVTTTMTYIWPIAMAVFACGTIRDYLDDNRIPIWKAILYCLSMIYAANQEQNSVLLLLVYGVTVAIILVRREKPKKATVVLIIQAMEVLANFLFHVLAPGNSMRREEEVANWFADYDSLSLIDKLEMGFSSTMYEFFFKNCYLMVTFAILLTILIWHRTKRLTYRVLPLTLTGCVLGFGTVLDRIMGSDAVLATRGNRGVIDEFNYASLAPAAILCGVILLLTVLLMCMIIAFGKSLTLLYAVTLFVGSMLARMILAFSPTVWASGNRTFGIMYVSIAGICALCVAECRFETFSKKKQVAVYGTVCLLCAMCLVDLALWTFGIR